MAEKKKKDIKQIIEREYTIPLREKCRSVPRYKKTPKAVKTIKQFLVRHMKIRDRDLKKIKIDPFLNEMLWFRGIKKPPYKIKVKVTKEKDIVTVQAVELMKNLEFKKKRLEKRESLAEEIVEKKKSMMQKAKESMQGTPKVEKQEDKDQDGVEDVKEEKEKQKAVSETSEKQAKEQAKKSKHATSVPRQKTAPVRKALSK